MGTVNRSFEGIALRLAPDSKFSNSEAARTFVLKKFDDLSDPVLMIFDNYDNPIEFPTIRDYFPHRSKIILNSRHTDAKRLGKDVEIGAMTAEVSILRSPLLLRHAWVGELLDSQTSAALQQVEKES